MFKVGGGIFKDLETLLRLQDSGRQGQRFCFLVGGFHVHGNLYRISGFACVVTSCHFPLVYYEGPESSHKAIYIQCKKLNKTWLLSDMTYPVFLRRGTPIIKALIRQAKSIQTRRLRLALLDLSALARHAAPRALPVPEVREGRLRCAEGDLLEWKAGTGARVTPSYTGTSEKHAVLFVS